MLGEISHTPGDQQSKVCSCTCVLPVIPSFFGLEKKDLLHNWRYLKFYKQSYAFAFLADWHDEGAGSKYEDCNGTLSPEKFLHIDIKKLQ